MQKWQYKQEMYIHSEKPELSRWGDGRLKRTPFMHMQELGKEGWELTAIETIVRGNERLTFYWLKKPYG